MSLTLYPLCESHDPPIRADLAGECGQHGYDLANAIAAFEGAPLPEPERRQARRFAKNVKAFAEAHPRCSVAIEDQYGEVLWRREPPPPVYVSLKDEKFDHAKCAQPIMAHGRWGEPGDVRRCRHGLVMLGYEVRGTIPPYWRTLSPTWTPVLWWKARKRMREAGTW